MCRYTDMQMRMTNFHYLAISIMNAFENSRVSSARCIILFLPAKESQKGKKNETNLCHEDTQTRRCTKESAGTSELIEPKQPLCETWHFIWAHWNFTL